MATKLFVGSLPYSITDDQLEGMFKEFGTIASAKVIMNRDTGQSKGFGFVEMENDEDAKAAIDQLNGREIEGRRIVVNEARPQEDRGDRRGNFGGGDREPRY